MVFFGLLSTTALRIFLLVFIMVEGNRAHRLGRMALYKNLNSSPQKIKCHENLLFFGGGFSKTVLRFFPILCVNVEDNLLHRLYKIDSLKNS